LMGFLDLFASARSAVFSLKGYVNLAKNILENKSVTDTVIVFKFNIILLQTVQTESEIMF
jgi:hypothetical protein